ncbi:MAG: hypothetical protein AAF611_14470 [Bacteroidota bacterium]
MTTQPNTEKINLSIRNALLAATILIVGTIATVQIFFPREVTKLEIPNFICENYSEETPSELPIDAIFKMTNQYRDNQLKWIQDRLKTKDARAVWFDLQTLKKFLYAIEHITKKNDRSISDERLGVCIYYGSYLEKDNEKYIGLTSDQSDNLARKHTVVMIPTIERDGKNYDYNPLDVATYEKELKYVKSQTNYTPASSSTIIALGATESANRIYNNSTIARNHGGLFPPRSTESLHFLQD